MRRISRLRASRNARAILRNASLLSLRGRGLRPASSAVAAGIGLADTIDRRRRRLIDHENGPKTDVTDEGIQTNLAPERTDLPPFFWNRSQVEIFPDYAVNSFKKDGDRLTHQSSCKKENIVMVFLYLAFVT
ncbi:MAG: hypothetical protein R3C97_10480 [Geminicoccaceae bacterium]